MQISLRMEDKAKPNNMVTKERTAAAVHHGQKFEVGEHLLKAVRRQVIPARHVGQGSGHLSKDRS